MANNRTLTTISRDESGLTTYVVSERSSGKDTPAYGPNDDAATTVIDRTAVAAITPVPVARTVAL